MTHFLFHYHPSLPDITLTTYRGTEQFIETSDIKIARNRKVLFNLS
jgi:hypothetical protein